MAAVKAPYGTQALFQRSFSPVPDSPWPKSAMSMTPNTAAAHNNMFHPSRFSGSHLAAPPLVEEATTPSDITAPSPSTSETGTIFTDVDGEDEPQSTTDEQPRALEVDDSTLQSLKSPANILKIDTSTLTSSAQAEDDEPPQSVIHIPSGFGRFHGQPGSRPGSRLSQTYLSQRHQRSLSQSSAGSTRSVRSSRTEPAIQNPISLIERPSTAASVAAESTAPSESTLKVQDQSDSADEEAATYFAEMAGSPLQPVALSSKDWASTPRAQTRQELSFSRPGSSLASIREGDDDVESEHYASEAAVSDLDTFSRRRASLRKSEGELQALEVALAECWTLCNTLQNLSNRHRDKMFSKGNIFKSDMHEKAWKTCWKLCQNLYDSRDPNVMAGTKNTLSLCREFCQALFEVRIRNNEANDSVLRVSFELNNHLFNTHDRSLPEAFRERTLDFYITLCHRLMKQKSKMADETDQLLGACWTLAEMLFSIRQSRRENRRPDQELLGTAMQACWDLCNLFREGWTQVRPGQGTPKASQTTFSQAFQFAKRAGYIDDHNSLKITPETPTTIFDDTATISPEEAPVPTISVMGNDHSIPQSAKTTASAPLPRPNTTQRMSRATLIARQNHRGWGSINEVVADEEPPTRPESALSASSTASSTQMSLASSLASSQHTIRTPAEDPSLTILKALFVRAAVQTGRGFSADPRKSVGRDSTHTSLPAFVRSLPENAFGSQVWQRNLLEHYKKTVSQDSTFKYLGTQAATIGLGADPEKGREDVAAVLKGMVDNTDGWTWLRDLFKYGYGANIDEVLNKAKETPPAPTEMKNRGGLPNGRSNSSVSRGSALSNGHGNEGRKVSPPRRA